MGWQKAFTKQETIEFVLGDMEEDGVGGKPPFLFCLWLHHVWIPANTVAFSDRLPGLHFLFLPLATCSFVADLPLWAAVGENIPLSVALLWEWRLAVVRQWESGKFKGHPFYFTLPRWSSVIPSNSFCGWSESTWRPVCLPGPQKSSRLIRF